MIKTNNIYLILISLLVIQISCKKSISLIPSTEICTYNFPDSTRIKDYTTEGVCTIFQNQKSLKGKITLAKRDSIIKLIMLDELGVPLIVTSDSLDQCALLRRFPPLNDDEAFKVGLAITATYRRYIYTFNNTLNCNYVSDLKNENTEVFYCLKDNEKDLTKIVHNNDFYYIHHGHKNEGELYNSKNNLLAKFKFNK